MTDIERWRKQLEKTLDEVNAEMAVLAEAKESCERALEAKAMPHDVVTQCLSTREGRRQYEVVRDPVEHSLNNENLLIEKIRSQLKVCLRLVQTSMTRWVNYVFNIWPLTTKKICQS